MAVFTIHKAYTLIKKAKMLREVIMTPKEFTALLIKFQNVYPKTERKFKCQHRKMKLRSKKVNMMKISFLYWRIIHFMTHMAFILIKRDGTRLVVGTMMKATMSLPSMLNLVQKMCMETRTTIKILNKVNMMLLRDKLFMKLMSCQHKVMQDNS